MSVNMGGSNRSSDRFNPHRYSRLWAELERVNCYSGKELPLTIKKKTICTIAALKENFE